MVQLRKRTPPGMMTGMIDQISCEDFTIVYIGETGRINYEKMSDGTRGKYAMKRCDVNNGTIYMQYMPAPEIIGLMTGT